MRETVNKNVPGIADRNYRPKKHEPKSRNSFAPATLDSNSVRGTGGSEAHLRLTLYLQPPNGEVRRWSGMRDAMSRDVTRAKEWASIEPGAEKQ